MDNDSLDHGASGRDARQDDLVIDVQGLRRRYASSTRGAKGFEAVAGVDLQVRRGELFALLGTNGAGKTSLLEVVEGLSRPTAGTAKVFGKDPYRERAQVRPRIGIMLQEAGFPSDLTAIETARMWAGTLADPRPVEEALDLVALRGRADVTVTSLSGGERRRLDLALALLGRPEVLFLDEPTTGLDPESRRSAWDLVQSLLDDGTTVVLTTHYLEEAERLADRLAIMHGGRIVQEGTVAEIVDAEPAHVYVDEASVRPHLADLPLLPGESLERVEGGMLSIATRDLQRSLAVLLAWAADRDVTFGRIEARPASLEQAFLAIADGPGASRPGLASSTIGPTERAA
ncbi:ABC transporter ATP-binding protein [Oerskovia sp. Root22]|uniref:ABC transporter ATP-binding protein n=1 Tax=Oerskovia sp. Root22 TaxID=1736494 RepID=UPI0006F6833A|nr:ABC transporter ATP-binding protein [Oerskovia sp. Root22]KRC37579.1 multidrug ABC transporter ATP-binding protein [Oerskovia sp. Root22]